MPSLATFSWNHCATCGDIRLHNGKGCTSCHSIPPPPAARDIGALTFSGGTLHNLQRRMDRLAERNRAFVVETPRPRQQYARRPNSLARECEVLSRLAAGTTNLYEIGRELSITGAGVRLIVLRLCERLAVPYTHSQYVPLIEKARACGVLA